MKFFFSSRVLIQREEEVFVDVRGEEGDEESGGEGREGKRGGRERCSERWRGERERVRDEEEEKRGEGMR